MVRFAWYVYALVVLVAKTTALDDNHENGAGATFCSKRAFAINSNHTKYVDICGLATDTSNMYHLS